MVTVRPTPSSLVTFPSEPSNGPLRNISSHAELSTLSESPRTRTTDPEDSLTLNSEATPRLLRPWSLLDTHLTEESSDSISPRAGEVAVEAEEEIEVVEEAASEEAVETSEADAEAAVASEEEAETAEAEEASEVLHVEAEAHQEELQDSREPELCCEHDRKKGKVYIDEICQFFFLLVA